MPFDDDIISIISSSAADADIFIDAASLDILMLMLIFLRRCFLISLD